MKEDKKREDTEEKKIEEERRVNVESEDVPLYRSYGVTKKVNPVMRAIKENVAKIVTAIFLAIELFLIFFVTFMLAFYTGVLTATIMFVILFSIFAVNATKLPRRRWSFLRKLKKACKQNGYELDVRRGFFKALTWSKEPVIDFKLTAGKWTYYVKFATSKRFLSSFTFVSKDEVKYTKIARKSRIATIFDFKDRTKSMRIAFPSEIDSEDKYSVKAILVNPAVMNLEQKGRDGVIVPTGSGEKLFGYTIFTGVGFLETVKRNVELDKESSEKEEK